MGFFDRISEGLQRSRDKFKEQMNVLLDVVRTWTTNSGRRSRRRSCSLTSVRPQHATSWSACRIRHAARRFLTRMRCSIC